MPAFQKDNTASVGHGRPKGTGTGGQVKNWLLNQIYEILKEGGPEEVKKRLRSVRDTDLLEFLNLMVKLLPRDIHADLNINRFSDWSLEELNAFVETGTYPYHEEN